MPKWFVSGDKTFSNSKKIVQLNEFTYMLNLNCKSKVNFCCVINKNKTWLSHFNVSFISNLSTKIMLFILYLTRFLITIIVESIVPQEILGLRAN